MGERDKNANDMCHLHDERSENVYYQAPRIL